MGVILVLDIGLAVGKQASLRRSERGTVAHEPGKLQVAHHDGTAEDIHLAAVIVDVVLALHPVVGMLEHVA